MRYLFVLLFLTGIAHAQVRLDWQPNVDSDLSSYNVYQAKANLSSGTLAYNKFWVAEGTTFTLIANTVDTYFLALDLDEKTTYTYFVTAKDTSGLESLPSNLVKIAIKDRTSPLAVQSLRILEVSKTTKTVTVNFNVTLGEGNE